MFFLSAPTPTANQSWVIKILNVKCWQGIWISAKFFVAQCDFVVTTWMTFICLWKIAERCSVESNAQDMW